jgi:hypothetical protein
MTESMITVAMVVDDPAHEDLQLNETSLAAAGDRPSRFMARSFTAGGTRAGAARSGASTSSAPAPRILRTICKPSGPASLSPLSGGQSGQPRSFVSAEGRRPGTCYDVRAPGAPAHVPYPSRS